MVDFDELTDEQREATDALDRNVTLTAGAGTGKTTTLTARYVRMLARGLDDDAPADADSPLLPEEILTTTFTERAANELQQDIREAITYRVADADADTYERWREVADGLEDGYIHTVHGFCARLLREHAIAADTVDPGFETLDERETAALLDDTVATLLETRDDHEAVETLARRFDRAALHDVLTDLLTERPGGIEWAERWADATREEYLAFVNEQIHPVSPATAADRLSDPQFVAAVTTLRELHGTPPAALDTGGQTWTRAAGIVDTLDGVSLADCEPTAATRDRFVALCDHLTTGDGDRYASYTGAATRWSGAEMEKDRFDDALATVVETLEPAEHLVGASMAVDANSVPFVRALARVTLLAHDEYTERKRARNVVDFTDQIEFALEFVKNAPEDRRAALRDQFAYVMIDEFQDTDPRQWELVAHLTAEEPDDFDARNVFVVGDTKQSIYRFRNADVTQFAETAETLAAANPAGATVAEEEQLSTNFRTLPGVLDGVDALFAEIFDDDPDAPAYEARPQRLSAYRDDPDSLASLEYLAVPTDPNYRSRRFDGPFGDARPQHDAELEGMALAARLTQLFDDEVRIYDEDAAVDEPEPRPVEPSDVAILLRSRTHLEEYERALEDADVPFTVASGLGFFDTPEITALVNLLRAVADPGDERALYGALRSPLFGLTDDTLAMLKRDGEPLWTALGAADAEELRDAHKLLVAWRGRVGLGDGPASVDGAWAALLTQIIDETGFLTAVSADERPQQAVANVEKFRELLREYGDEGVTSLPTLVRRLERQRSLGDREGDATIQGGGEGVRLLTVHDAKGMEFPVVVVPGVGKQFNMRAAVGSGRVEFEEIGDGEYAVGLKAPDPDDPFDDVATVAREALQERRRAEERAEEKRVLYVACTRARDRLLLTGLHDLDGEDLTDVEGADPEDASSWRDWVQPHVLSDDVLSELGRQMATTSRLGDAEITVSLPTPPADWRDQGTPSTPRVERSATPPRPDRRFSLSPTDLASLFDGRGQLRIDERTNTVYFESDDHGGDDTGSSGDDDESLAPTVFGEVVHRLCELRPPEERWDDVVEQTLVAEGAVQELTVADRVRVRDHAEHAMARVDDIHADNEVVHSYDELHVTAEFETGDVSGLVDHLVLTPEGYRIVDYKTNDITAAEVEAKADFYRTQLAAYAVALHQNDPEKRVSAELYFTTPDGSYTFEWSPSELASIETDLQTRIDAAVDSSQ